MKHDDQAERGDPPPDAGDDDLGRVRPSKSQRKRDAHDLQDLGEAVAALSAERLARLDLPDPLRDAIELLRRVRSHEGRRRQMQLVGKHMRSVDPEPLRAAVAEARLGGARDALKLHEAERWRDALIADDGALTRFIQQHPGADAGELRRVIRAARNEGVATTGQRQGKAYRQLFKALQPLLQPSAAPADAVSDPDGDAV